MKKIKIIFWVLFSIVAFLAFNFLRTFNFLRDYNKNLKDIKGQLNIKYNDDNFPEFAKDYVFSKTDIEILSEKTLYDSKSQEKIIEETKKILPENIKDYRTKLAPSILELMRKEKTNKYPTVEETENYPAQPQSILIRATAYNWSNLSLIFSKEGDYKTSLLIAHGIFYLVREKQKSYAASGTMIDKMVSNIYLKYASKAILVWASKAHLDCQELSKTVAKDILKLVEVDYPLKRNFEFNKYAIDSILKHFSTKTSLVGNNVFNKSYYKEIIDFLINEPLRLESKLESKNYYEIKDEYSKYSKKMKDALETRRFSKIFPNFCINPEKAIVYAVADMFCTDLERVKLSSEESLSYMEFSAIALLINSYYCENNKLPETIDELEKWFGQKLPVSRFNYEPYIIDTKGKHLLTFKHVDKSYEIKDSELYFDFSN